MYVIIFLKPLLIKDVFCLAKNSEISGEINVEMYIIEKSKKINSDKTVSPFSLKPVFKMARNKI